MDMPKYVAKWEKVDDLTVKLTLTEPNAPMLANLGMDFASILSKEYADQLEEAGKMADLSTKPIGTGPVPVRRLPARRRHPLRGPSGLLQGQGEDRRSDLRHHARCDRRASRS